MGKTNKWVLVTGGSSGIGLAFARELAAANYNLVLVSRDKNLAQVAADLETEFAVKVETLRVDLASDDDLARVVARLKSTEKPIEILINGAGFVLHDSLISGDLSRQKTALKVMAEAILVLSQTAAAMMKKRASAASRFHSRETKSEVQPEKFSEGIISPRETVSREEIGEKARPKFHIINIASTSAFFYNGNYSALKRWVLVYTESLALELRGSGVTATAVCPGETQTDFHANGGLKRPGIPAWLWCRPEQIARAGLRAAERGKIIVVPTVKWRVIAWTMNHFQGLARKISRKMVAGRVAEVEQKNGKSR